MTCPARPGSAGPAAPTASAAGRSKVPANTPRRANSACSRADSRSKLQFRVFRSVCCRSGRSRAPPVSSPILSSSRASRACGGKSLTLAAASSMASGSPSSRWQISATAPAFPLVSSKPADAACARCTNRRTDAHRCTFAASPPAPAGGTGSGGTGNSCSPLSRNTIRLVTSATTPGAAPSSSATSGAAPITCSKLSSTSTSRRARRYDFTSVISAPPEVLSPSAAEIAAVTSSAARTEPSATNRTPSAKPAPTRCATSTASLLFPTPPGPVRVTRRTPSARTRSPTAATSSSRPTSGVAGTGNAPASDAPSAAPSRAGAPSNRSLSSTARSFSTRRCSSAAAEKY